MINIGKISEFTVTEVNEAGYMLEEKSSNKAIYMPRSLARIRHEEKDEVKAFAYVEGNGDLVATTVLPVAVVGEYALLEAVNVQDFGAFFNWGIKKDLLVPGNEQKIKVTEGGKYLVRICLEEGADRVFGTTKLGKFIEDADFDIQEKDKVRIVPVQGTDLGYRVIVNKKFIGMIYHNEIFTEIELNTPYYAVVKKIRMDGLIDLALQTQGVMNLFEAKEVILETLAESNGQTTTNDKSSPDQIRREFGMSKKTFKAAVGMLYKDRKLVISKDGIKLS